MSRRASLQLVGRRAARSDVGTATFCSHCGEAPDGDPAGAPRVCGSCGMGLMLQAPADVAPDSDAPFLVVDATLIVGAVSQEAERFLAVDEADVVNRPVTELLDVADAEAVDVDLASAIMWAAGGEVAPRELYVRPTNTFGVRCRARVGPCGPPSAAVVILEA